MLQAVFDDLVSIDTEQCYGSTSPAESNCSEEGTIEPNFSATPSRTGHRANREAEASSLGAAFFGQPEHLEPWRPDLQQELQVRFELLVHHKPNSRRNTHRRSPSFFLLRRRRQLHFEYQRLVPGVEEGGSDSFEVVVDIRAAAFLRWRITGRDPTAKASYRTT